MTNEKTTSGISVPQKQESLLDERFDTNFFKIEWGKSVFETLLTEIKIKKAKNQSKFDTSELEMAIDEISKAQKYFFKNNLRKINLNPLAIALKRAMKAEIELEKERIKTRNLERELEKVRNVFYELDNA